MGGARWDDWRAGLTSPRHRSAAADVPGPLAQRLQRRRRKSMSRGGPAAGVTRSAATGATVEPRRAPPGIRRPGYGLGECEVWRSGRPSAQGRRSRSACSPSGPVHAQRKEAGPGHPSTGRAAASCKQSRFQAWRTRRPLRRRLLLHLSLERCLPGIASLLFLPEQASTLTAKKVKPSATAEGSFL